MKTKSTNLATALCRQSITVILLTLTLNSYAQSPGWLWAKSMGSTGIDGGNAVAIDAAGNIYTVGSFSGTVDFDPGAGVYNLASAGLSDIFITKSDGSGNFIWAKRFGGVSNDFCWSVTVDAAGHVFSTGHFTGTIDFDPGAGTVNLTASGFADVFISKLDNAGNYMWARAMGGPDNDDYGYSIITDMSGNVYTTGVFSGTADFDPGSPGTYSLTAVGGPDIFISKLNGAGNFLWAKAIGGIDYENGFSITADASANVYITGYFSGSVDFNPGSTGTLFLTSSGLFDIYVVKLNAAGDFQWAKAMGGAEDDYGSAAKADDAGNIYTLGHFQGTVDFDPGPGVYNLVATGSSDIFISKINSSGGFVWAKAFGGTGYDDGFSISVDATGNVYAAGRFVGVVDFNPGAGTFIIASAGWGDGFISKFDNSGNFVWAKAVGGINDDGCKSIALDGTGDLVITGGFVSPSISFGSISLSNLTGTSDIYLAKLDNNPTGLEDVEAGHTMIVYPNPVSDHYYIAVSGKYDDAEIIIMDLNGKIIPVTTTASSIGTMQQFTVNIPENNIASGIYFVKVSTIDFIVTRKISVVK